MLTQFHRLFKLAAAPWLIESAFGTSSVRVASSRWRSRSSSWKRSMSVIRITLYVVAVVVVICASACTAAQDVPLNELLSSPDRYDGRWVCTEGIHATGFEVNALGAQLRRQGGEVYLAGPLIWLEGAEIVSSTDCFDSPTGAARFCQATVCGLFASGGRYGHLGGYEYQLRAPDR
jgi:hypothetical protein